MKIILLRGLARESAHWGNFPTVLKNNLECRIKQDIEIYTPDFPGVGTLYKSHAKSHIKSMTEFIRENHQGKIHDKTILIGLSMGGMVSLDWITRYPSEIHHVFIVNSSIGNSPFFWRLLPTAWPSLLLALILSPEKREKFILQKTSNLKANSTNVLNHWIAIQQSHPVSRKNITRMLKASASYSQEKCQFSNGVIINSQQDRLVSPKSSRYLSQLLDWELVTHPTAGHDLPLDDPQWLAEEIMQRLK